METKVNNYSSAFNAFVKWSQKRSFNEILGCAKIGIENLCLIWDVDAYDLNKIAFRTLYTDADGNWTEIEVVLENNICVFHHTKGKEVVEQNTLSCEDMVNYIGENRTYDDIAEAWNEYVDHTDPNIPKVFQIHHFDLSHLTECLTDEEMKKVFTNLWNTNFNTLHKYFKLDENYHLRSSDNVFELIDIEALYRYIKRNEPKKMFGRTWQIFDTDDNKKENEWLIGEFPNGKMYMNSLCGYLMFYETNGNTYLSWV